MSEEKVIRNYRDTMFRLLFKGKKELLSLYNATNGTNYTNEDDLEVNTLENAVYMNMKNDISFVFDFELNLYEHQSSVNPNMPLRDLFYVSKVLQNIVQDEDLYSRVRVKIPTPKFVVFYNGVERMPERCEYRLSDLFEKPVEEPELELIVTVLNINPGKNEQLVESCRLLKEYMIYVSKVRENQKIMSVEDAVKRAVDDCIAEGILEDFLRKNKAEAIMVSIYEYDEEKHMKSIRKEGYEEGVSVGHARGLEDGLMQGIRAFIADCLEEQVPQERIIEKLIRRFDISQEKAEQYLKDEKAYCYQELLELIPAGEIPSTQILQFRKEFLDAGEHAINGSRGLHNYEKYEDWLHLVQECSKPNNQLIGVETTTYFARRKSDDKLVGCIELRHTLNQALEEIGGHVGYSVLPAERRKGYATRMLEMIITKSKELGIDKLLLTCDIDNVGSNKTVVSCGGILEEGNPFSYKGEQIYKYWINV